MQTSIPSFSIMPAEAGPGLSLHTIAQLERYVSLLEKWASVTNLISRSALRDVWMRHLHDCLQLVRFAPDARHWLDVGSGAGLPGIVVAIQLVDFPGAQIHLVESDGRKCVFLREVVRELKLPVRVYRHRIETLAPTEIWPVEVVTSRAFASLRQTLVLLEPFINNGATALLSRGKTAPAELDELSDRCYGLECACNPTGSGGYILAIKRRMQAASL